MKLNTFFTTVLILITIQNSNASSFREEKSFVCKDNFQKYKGINCCLENINFNTCKKLIDTHISEKYIKTIQKVQKDIKENKYSYGRVPNCHWNALAFNLDRFKNDLFPVESYELEAEITKYFKGITQKEFKSGDILVFESNKQMRDVEEVNGVPRRVWSPIFHDLEHTVVYLQDNIIFQKENIGTSIFSINTLKHTLETYQSGINNTQFRGTLHILPYRLK